MLIEIHMLKNYPATNLNRDDTGSPKSCIFGGVQRARISSQCLKRSWRTSPLFHQEIGKYLGVRTRKMPELVCKRLKEMGVAEALLPVLQEKLTGFANKSGTMTNTGRTAQVVIYSPEDIDAIADAVKAKVDEGLSEKQWAKVKSSDLEKLVTGADARPISLDIALFGRMVTSPAFADVEASMQVAHAFSTHRVAMETDFFTAMDDLINGREEELGSAMMGDVDFNSSCYYLYASLDTCQLRENLKHSEDVDAIMEAAIPALLHAIAYSNPSGKQNSFAGNVLPSAILVECKDYPIPVNYANAFVAPARATGQENLVAASVRMLKEEVQRTLKDFPDLGAGKRFWFCAGGTVEFDQEGIALCSDFRALVDGVRAAWKE